MLGYVGTLVKIVQLLFLIFWWRNNLSEYEAFSQCVFEKRVVQIWNATFQDLRIRHNTKTEMLEYELRIPVSLLDN